MSERLLLPSANVAPKPNPRQLYARLFFGAVGTIVVLYGTADLVSRAADRAFGDHAALAALGPAVVELNQTRMSTLATSTSALVPTKLSIQSVGVSADVEQVGQKADGSMAAPSSFTTVGWYKEGSMPGEEGSAVFAGHVNNALTKAGVFEHLDHIALGDVIVVSDAYNKTLRFAVTDIEDYPTATAPLNTIFATSGPSQIVLITCAGDWDPRAKSYDHRLVVFARLLPS
ncbi:MAG: hypothetical protein QG621_438 [Patescibacteria group bacterium]|nr:hypothetical protein [Patescibacteria group bacterium]